jgi:hypothetical protein
VHLISKNISIAWRLIDKGYWFTDDSWPNFIVLAKDGHKIAIRRFYDRKEK